MGIAGLVHVEARGAGGMRSAQDCAGMPPGHLGKGLKGRGVAVLIQHIRVRRRRLARIGKRYKGCKGWQHSISEKSLSG